MDDKNKKACCWWVTNISRRKASQIGGIKESADMEIINNWHNNLQNLLRSPPKRDDEQEEVKTLLEDLTINMDQFDIE